jgi:large subunit ribosomal protein L34e
LPKPMHRSSSFRRLDRVTPKNKHVIHFKRRPNSKPHCAICDAELNGIPSRRTMKGRTLGSNARKFGGILCSRCSASVIKLASRIEQGEMKLNDIGTAQRNYVLQMISH